MKPIFTLLLFLALLFFNDLMGNHPDFPPHSTSKVTMVSTNTSTVSPSPAHDFATIKFYNPYQKEHQIEVFDLIGNKVQFHTQIFKNEALINVSDLNTGFYLYFILHNKKRVSSGRIVVK